MKTKLISLTIALLIGVSVWADAPVVSVSGNCSSNGYEAEFSPAPSNVQAVDLGLPSGIKWASCNVGANKPEDCGNYYAWGEVLPKKDYSWATYSYANNGKLTKYYNNATYGDNGFTDSETTLDADDDAAHMNWGGNWRMPTSEDIDELLNICTWTETTQNGVYGYVVESKKNSSSIFLPAAGYRCDTSIVDVGSNGYCWSSSLGEGGPYNAWNLYFLPDDMHWACNRVCGFPVRPVCP